jgi:hypothetical protein
LVGSSSWMACFALQVATGSWDRTVCIWDVLRSGGQPSVRARAFASLLALNLVFLRAAVSLPFAEASVQLIRLGVSQLVATFPRSCSRRCVSTLATASEASLRKHFLGFLIPTALPGGFSVWSVFVAVDRS